MSWLSKAVKKVKKVAKKVDPTRTKVGKVVKRGVGFATAPMRLGTQLVIKGLGKTGIKPLKKLDSYVNKSDSTFNLKTTTGDAVTQWKIGAAVGAGMMGIKLGEPKKEDPKLETSKSGQTVSDGINKKYLVFGGIGVGLAVIIALLWD